MVETDQLLNQIYYVNNEKIRNRLISEANELQMQFDRLKTNQNYTIICKECGIDFERENKREKYCEDCREIIASEKSYERQKKSRESMKTPG